MDFKQYNIITASKISQHEIASATGVQKVVEFEPVPKLLSIQNASAASGQQVLKSQLEQNCQAQIGSAAGYQQIITHQLT